MKVTLLLASNRSTGKHIEIKESLQATTHDLEYIELSKLRVESCRACEKCKTHGRCVIDKADDFSFILQAMIACDALLILTPVYAPIPSKLTAVFERLICLSFFGAKMGGFEKPLLGKNVGLVMYGAHGICECKSLKLMLQQCFTHDYNFDGLTYAYWDDSLPWQGKSLNDYVKALLESLDPGRHGRCLEVK